MASAHSNSHPSVHTKSVFGWINPATITSHHAGNANYSLHAVSLPHPPPPDRASAVRINSRHNNHYFIVEARKMTDQYERVDAQGDGIGREGAIVYEVENTNNVFLRTTIALRVGQSCSNVDEGFKVEVLQDIVGGYQVRITRSQTNTCPQLLSRIQALQTQYDHTTDNDLR